MTAPAPRPASALDGTPPPDVPDADLPAVSVIFPTWNRCDVVEQTIRRLAAQDYPARRVELLVCDNSTDGTQDMVHRVAGEVDVDVVLMASDERLPAVKRNQGLVRAGGELVVFLNDDVWVRPDFLRRHVAHHAAVDGPVAVLGHVEQSPAMPQDPFIEWYRPFAYDRIADRAHRTVPFWFHWSMNLSHPRDVLVDRNLVFHEDWADIGHEDVELGYRWTRAGYPVVYAPDAWGEHFHPHDLRSACRLQTSIGKGLRDLEVLVPEPDLLEHYGVCHRGSSLRGKVRGTARRALFNRYTVPPLLDRLAEPTERSRLAEWSYWKLMLHHTEQGYAEAPARSPRPTPTRPLADAGDRS